MSLSMNEFASRPVHAASAARVSFLILGVIASLAAGKAMMAQGLTTPAMAEPAAPAAVAKIAMEAVAANAQEPAKNVCRQVEVEIDEGYGVRGHVTRWVCRKAF